MTSKDVGIDDAGDVFPDENDAGDEREKGISWKDLPIDIWYRIDVKRDVTTCYGPTNLLTLRDRNNTRFLVWTTSLITQTINAKWVEKDAGTLFICSLGKKKSASTKFSFFDYKYKIIK